MGVSLEEPPQVCELGAAFPPSRLRSALAPAHLNLKAEVAPVLPVCIALGRETSRQDRDCFVSGRERTGQGQALVQGGCSIQRRATARWKEKHKRDGKCPGRGSHEAIVKTIPHSLLAYVHFTHLSPSQGPDCFLIFEFDSK